MSWAKSIWPRLALSILVVAALVWLGRGYFGELDRLKSVSPAWLLSIAGLFVLVRVAQSEMVRHLLKKLGFALGKLELYLVLGWMSYANLLVPRAGLGAPALYLKLEHRVSFAQFGSLLYPQVAANLVALGGTGLTLLAWLSARRPVEHSVALAMVFGAVGLVGVFLLFLPIPRWAGGRVGEFLDRFESSWAILREDFGLLAGIFSGHVLVLLLQAARLLACLRAVGESAVGFPEVLMISLLADLMFLLTVTPSAIGLREAVIAVAGGSLGVDPSVAVSAGVLDRIVTTLVVVVLAQVGVWRLGRRAGEA